MRMKKLMIFAVAAIALVACSKEFDTNKSASNGTAIGFGTWAEQLTKATSNTVDGTFAVNDNFKVWGSKLVSSTPSDVFTGVTVTKTNASPETWNYSPKQYWDLSADSYTFYAVAPAADGYTVNTTTGQITASPTITFTGNDSDILVAQKALVPNTGGNFNNFAKVPLIFNHAAAWVDVKVKISAGLVAAGAHVQVSSIALQNISKEGTFTVAGDYTTAPEATWTASTPAAGTVAEYNHASGLVSGAAGLNTDLDASGTVLVSKLVVMPQDFRDAGDFIQKLDIDYNITQNGGSANNFTPAPIALTDFDDVEDKDNDDTAVTGWAPGTHYTYVVTIDAHTIEFSATISAWSTEDAFHYLIN